MGRKRNERHSDSDMDCGIGWGGSVPSKADRVTLTVRVAIEDYVMFTSSLVSSKPEVTYEKMSLKNIIQLQSALNPIPSGL